MIAVPIAQIAGSVTGGLVGGFAGFVANTVLERSRSRSNARNVGCALIGEISALCHHIKLSPRGGQSFRGDRDYTPIYHSLGLSIGSLSSELARDLVSWYTGLMLCLERARHLHELSFKGGLTSDAYLLESEIQRKAFDELVVASKWILERLAEL